MYIPLSFRALSSFSFWVVLVTSIHFSGIGNHSSFGTWRRTVGSTWWRWMKSTSIDPKSLRASASSFVSAGWEFRVSLKFFAEIYSQISWSPPSNFAVASAIGKIKKHPFWTLSFPLHRAFERGFLTRSIFQAPWRLQPRYLPSRFSPQPLHIRGIFMAGLSYQIGGALIGLLQRSESIQPLLWTVNGPSNGSPNRLS